MIHRTFESIEVAVMAALRGDPEFESIAARLRDHGILLSLEGEDGPVLVRKPDINDKRSVLMLLLRVEPDETPGGSVVYIGTLVNDESTDVSALFLEHKPCLPFWFGLKFVHDWLIFERSRDYALLKERIVDATRVMYAENVTRQTATEFRRESHLRLRRHAEETRRMRERLCFRAINRLLDGALNDWLRKEYRMVLRDQNELLREIACDIHERLQRIYPEALSYEETAARCTLIACATSHVASLPAPSKVAVC